MNLEQSRIVRKPDGTVEIVITMESIDETELDLIQAVMRWTDRMYARCGPFEPVTIQTKYGPVWIGMQSVPFTVRR